MRQLPKYWFPCLLALLLPAACAPARGATNAPKRSLLEQATTRTDTSGWDIDYHHAFGYHWLSAREVLFERNDDKNNGIFRRDVVTGREHRLNKLERLITKLWAGGYSPNVSPDGKWAFLYSRKLQRTELVALDGSCHHSVPKAMNYYWMVDSSHFAVLCFGGGEVGNAAYYWLLGTIKKPLTTSKMPVRSSLSLDIRTDKVCNGKWFLLTKWSDANWNELHNVQIYKSGLGVSMTPEAHNAVTIYNDTEPVSVDPSPYEQHIGYVLRRHLTPAASIPSAAVYELWISDNDGRNMHKVGDIARTATTQGDNHDAPIVRWLPGGTSVSLRYREILYTVPVR